VLSGAREDEDVIGSADQEATLVELAGLASWIIVSESPTVPSMPLM